MMETASRNRGHFCLRPAIGGQKERSRSLARHSGLGMTIVGGVDDGLRVVWATADFTTEGTEVHRENGEFGEGMRGRGWLGSKRDDELAVGVDFGGKTLGLRSFSDACRIAPQHRPGRMSRASG